MKQAYEITMRELSQIVADYISTKIGKSCEVDVDITAPKNMKADDVMVRAYLKK